MSNQTINRNYIGKDVDMLSACATIIEHAINHKPALIAKRSKWADPFFTNLQKKIQNAFTNYLGIDNAMQMRMASQTVFSIQKNALKDLAEFKIQVEEDFKNNKTRSKEILNNLGFTQLYKDSQSKDQEALIQLLLQFKKNMTTQLQTEITNAGTSGALITIIIGYADTLKNSNITQETLKGSRKEITQTAVTEFNDIYNQTISIAKISAKFFKNDPALKGEFSYAKTLKNLNQTKTTTKTETQVPVTA